MRKYNLFINHSNEEHADSIGAYLPNDVTFEAKYVPNTNFRNFLVGLGSQLRKFEEALNLLTNELGVDNVNYLLENWEKALGIPDDVFSVSVTTDERKRNVLAKLAKMNAQTKNDFEAVCLILGFTVTVLAGYDAINPPYSMTFDEITNDTEARFSIVVLYTASDLNLPTFTLTFPILFGSIEFISLEKMLNKIKPANCQLLMRGI